MDKLPEGQHTHQIHTLFMVNSNMEFCMGHMAFTQESPYMTGRCVFWTPPAT